MRYLIFSLKSAPDWLLIEPNKCSAVARAVSERKRGSAFACPFTPLAEGFFEFSRRSGSAAFKDSSCATRGFLRDCRILLRVARGLRRTLRTSFFADVLCIVFKCDT